MRHAVKQEMGSSFRGSPLQRDVCGPIGKTLLAYCGWGTRGQKNQAAAQGQSVKSPPPSHKIKKGSNEAHSRKNRAWNKDEVRLYLWEERERNDLNAASVGKREKKRQISARPGQERKSKKEPSRKSRRGEEEECDRSRKEGNKGPYSTGLKRSLCHSAEHQKRTIEKKTDGGGPDYRNVG